MNMAEGVSSLNTRAVMAADSAAHRRAWQACMPAWPAIAADLKLSSSSSFDRDGRCPLSQAQQRTLGLEGGSAVGQVDDSERGCYFI